jgi:hypothetical protein
LTGAAVFSHWVLDLPVHRPDLPLSTILSALDVAFLGGGLLLYLRATWPPLSVATPRRSALLMVTVEAQAIATRC